VPTSLERALAQTRKYNDTMSFPSLRGIARAYLISIAFWFGFALLMGLQYQPPDLHRFWSSFINFVAQAALRAVALALWTPPIFHLVATRLTTSKSYFRYVLLWSLGVVPFLLLQTTILWMVIVFPEGGRSFHSWLDVIRGNFADQAFIYVAVVVAAHGYEYLKCLRREERERYEYQQALAAAELQALKMQLQPHFLFNTLHGISTLIDGDPQTARAMIVKLSNLLRTVLDRDSSDLIPLEDELKFAKEYLDLEKMRFGSRLKIEWFVAPDTCWLLVPQMILQPLLENAIRHGVASAREGGWIEIAASADDGGLVIRLRNSVGGKTPDGTGVGLRNVEARLKYLYSGDANLHLALGDDRTATATLTVPALRSEREGAQTSRPAVVVESEEEYARAHRR
jgi:two-component system, LytTR family, sensor kinase